MSDVDAYALRSLVGKWLRLRAQHIEDSVGISLWDKDGQMPKDEQRRVLQQLANDAEHSDLLVRLFKGEEPLFFEEWKAR